MILVKSIEPRLSFFMYEYNKFACFKDVIDCISFDGKPGKPRSFLLIIMSVSTSVIMEKSHFGKPFRAT